MTASASQFPWLRRLKFTITGLTGGMAKEFISTGKPAAGKDEGYRLSAKICKSILGIPNATQLQMYNLSEETRNGFQRNETKIVIEAGWDEGPNPGLNHCFTGEVLSAESYRMGEDIVTHVSCISAFDALAKKEVVYAYPPQPVKSVILDLARRLEGVEVDSGRVTGIVDRIGPGGWPWSGRVKDALSALAREYKFSWSVVDNKFQAVGDKLSLGGTAEIADPYLIAINPILVGPFQHVRDVSWTCTFNPNIVPGYDITVRSKISQHGGTYRVNTVFHDLDPYAKRSFITSAVASILGKKNG